MVTVVVSVELAIKGMEEKINAYYKGYISFETLYGYLTAVYDCGIIDTDTYADLLHAVCEGE